MKKNRKRLFFNWLLNNNLLTQYKYNIRNVRDPISCLHDPTVRQNVYKYCSRFIVDAFYWADTKEGHDFWQQINTKWQKFIEKNIL